MAYCCKRWRDGIVDEDGVPVVDGQVVCAWSDVTRREYYIRKMGYPWSSSSPEFRVDSLTKFTCTEDILLPQLVSKVMSVDHSVI